MKVDKSKWKDKELRNIVNILNGYAFKSDMYCKEGVRIIRITNVQDGYIEDNDPKYYPLSFCNEISKYILNENDLLISLTGNVGRVAFLPEYMLPAALNQRVACIRLKGNDDIALKYLYYYMMNKSFKDECIKSSKGVAQLNMSTEWLKSYTIPIPPVHEQQSIASELDAIQTMIDGYKAQLDDLDVLAKSIFLDMFGDPVTNPKGWDQCKIGELCEVTSSKRIYQSEQSKIGVPFYRIGDFTKLIKDGVCNPELYISIEKYNELREAGLVPLKDDILLTSRGTLGLSYIVTGNDRFYFQDGMITWLKNIHKEVLSIFIGFIFKASLYEEQIKKMQNGSTIAYLSISMIKAFKIIVPPLALQQQFAAKIEAIESQKEKYKAQLADAKQLMAERMQYYFS